MAEARDPQFPEVSDASADSGSRPGSGPGSGSGSGSGSQPGSGSGSGSGSTEKTYQLSSMGLSVDSCLSAGELCEEEERQQLSAMSDSVYSTVSDVTLVGGCQCPSDGAPCRCDAGQASSSTDSGTSVREGASSKESVTLGSASRDQLECDEGAEPVRSRKEGHTDVREEAETQSTSEGAGGGQESGLPVVTVSVDSALPASGAKESEESAPLTSSDSREPDPATATVGGDTSLRVPEPDQPRRHSLDSSGILTAVFRQNEQFQELNDVEEDRPRSFTVSSEARRSQSQSRSTSASEGHSDPTGGGEGGSSPEYDLEEALYRFHHQRRDSYTSSSPSDVSVQELELETTGDFPHDFQFPDAGGSVRRPSAVFPDDAEAAERLAQRTGSSDRLPVRPQLSRTLSDQPRSGYETEVPAAGSLPVPSVVVEPAEEPTVAATAAAPPVSRSPPVRRGLLARLVDSTAAFLLGGVRDGGADRRHRSYTVTASDCRPAAAAAAAARRAAAAVGGDKTSASGGDPASGPSNTDSTRASPRSPAVGEVEGPAAPCRQCREPSCPPEAAGAARRRSIHSDDRPTARDTDRNVELLVPPHPQGDGNDATDDGRSRTSDDLSEERRKLRQQSMKNELRVKVTYHNVKPGETIPSIAAFYECLPGELKELNRLQFRKNVLPGQVLRILDRRKVQEAPKPEGGGDTGQDSGGGDGVSQGHRPRPSPGASRSGRPTPDEIRRKQYIQIRRTRLFTESEGVAVGTLMFTPNSLMFRPNVSDPLVVERGVEYYTVDIPVRYLVTAEYYTEPPHNSPAATSKHRQSHRESFATPAPDKPAESQPTSAEDGAAVDPATGSAAVDTATDGAQVPSRAKRPCSPDSDEGDRPQGAAVAVGGSQPSPTQSSKTGTRSTADLSGLAGSSGPGAGRDSSSPARPAAARRSQSPPARPAEAKRLAYSRGGRASFSAPPPPQEGEEECGSPLSVVIPIVSSASSVSSERLFPLSASLRSQGSIGADSPPPGATASEEAPSDKQPDQGPQGKRQAWSRRSSSSSTASLKNETSFDEKPSLFKAADELLRVHTPVVSQPPLYLELVTGKARGRLLPRAERTKVMFCGQRRLPSRVLFAVPRDSCEPLYKFLRRWAPDLSEDLDLLTKLEKQGFEQIDSDDDIWEPEELEGGWQKAELGDARGFPPPRAAHAIDAADGPAAQPPPSALDTAFLPELIGGTELLTDEARVRLQRHLPARVEGHPWQSVFNTAEHGFSLKTLYRQAVEYDCPMLLVVQDSAQNVFGAVCTDPIRFGKHFYGTGESFLFTLRPQFHAYRWSGENQYFARGSTDCLEFGSGDGRSGLFLDEGLVRGFTEPCQTYNNDLLTPTKDFAINAVEVWALG